MWKSAEADWGVRESKGLMGSNWTSVAPYGVVRSVRWAKPIEGNYPLREVRRTVPGGLTLSRAPRGALPQNVEVG